MNGGIGRETSLKDFIPTDNLTSFAVEELLGMVDHEALKVHLGTVLVIALYSQCLYACLTLGALLPLCLGALIAADVYVLRREHLDDLAEHVLDER